jgi:hypothetical protein
MSLIKKNGSSSRKGRMTSIQGYQQEKLTMRPTKTRNKEEIKEIFHRIDIHI